MLQLGAKDPLRLLQSRLPRLLLVVQPLDVGQKLVEGLVGQAIPRLAASLSAPFKALSRPFEISF